MTGAKESKPEGERGEGFEKGFCADTSNRDRQEQGRRGFLMFGGFFAGKRFAGKGLREDVELMRATRGIGSYAGSPDTLIPVLVTGIQPAQVLGLRRVLSPRRRASAGFL
ncbi:hypothetical protein [Agrobacterium leguminum]|uniref:hypothetical protein n=1 Tax=Agrobacterium leguminum TaxID=2792015 RepID=UPI003CE4C4C1